MAYEAYVLHYLSWDEINVATLQKVVIAHRMLGFKGPCMRKRLSRVQQQELYKFLTIGYFISKN